MRVGSFVTYVVAAVTIGSAVSCTRDNPMAPSTQSRGGAAKPTPSGAARGALLPAPVTIIPLQRTSPVQLEQVSATIGSFGGSIRLPNAGLTLVVPPFAVTSPVTITASALAGTNVAYELAPHGLRFVVPLVAIQDLRATEAAQGGPINPLSLSVGYFPSSLHITSVTELLNVNVNLFNQTATSLLWHFSGYVWSSGRSSEESSDRPGGAGQ